MEALATKSPIHMEGVVIKIQYLDRLTATHDGWPTEGPLLRPKWALLFFKEHQKGKPTPVFLGGPTLEKHPPTNWVCLLLGGGGPWTRRGDSAVLFPLTVDSFFILFNHRSFQKPDPFPWVSVFLF